MNRSDEYRRNADECQRMADNTSNENDKRAWLRLAESWMRMVRREAGQAAADRHDGFDTDHRAHGARSWDSRWSH